nr:uncharacterized protein LOC110084416 isoform X2 [Pogona vitticeps]
MAVGGGSEEAALTDSQVLALAGVHLAVLSLSLLGSGSILGAAVRRRRCCHDQLRPLFLLSLSDFLAALPLISAAAAHFLPAQVFISARAWCPSLLRLGMMFYAISFLMVIVYAYEVNRAVGGWRAGPVAVLEESTNSSSRLCRWTCRAKLYPSLPYILAWWVWGSCTPDLPAGWQAGGGGGGSPRFLAGGSGRERGAIQCCQPWILQPAIHPSAPCPPRLP